MANLSGCRCTEARDRKQIRTITYLLRKDLNLEKTKRFPIMEVLENVMPVLYPEFHLDIVEDCKLQGRMAETCPEQFEIRVKETVYQAACNGNAWARMVMAHELGHFMLHSSHNTMFTCMDRNSKIPPEMDPERQADIFAAELLMPMQLLKEAKYEGNLYLIQKHFGVSRSAAKAQLRQAEKVRRRHNRKYDKKEKRLSQNQPNR